MIKQYKPMTRSGAIPEESQTNPTSPNTETTTPKTWEQSWMEQAQKETPERRWLMEETLRRYREQFPEETKK